MSPSSFSQMKTGVGAALLALLCSSLSYSQVSFSFDFSDPSASYWSPASRAALDDAATRVSSYLTGYTASISLQVTGSNANTGTLASAGSYFTSPSVGFDNIGVIGRKVISNGMVDLNGSGFDGIVDANFFHSWSFSDSVGSGEYDFINVMMHELGHALGFMSLISQGGGSLFGDNTTSGGFYSPFDNYLVDGAGTNVVDHATFTTGSTWTMASTGGTGVVPAMPGTGLYFSGPNALIMNGGDLVPIYSPTTWQQGSSASHLDTDYYTGGNQRLMNHAVTTGIGVRQFSDLEVAIFQDLGYSAFGAIPEPSILGLAVGFLPAFMLRRARRKRS